MSRPRKINKDTDKEPIKSRRGRGSRKALATITGMKDILPQDQKYWRTVITAAEKIADDYGFGRLDSPLVETAEIFIRGLGKQTDIVEKQMFVFEDQGGDRLCLRPEGTASIVRAYIQHGMLNQPQPVRMFYQGPMFRHEKPQSGRSRQFYQFGFEAIGESNPALDVQLIVMGHNVLNDVGIEATIQVNSLGCSNCREEYKKSLIKYYRSKYKLLCEDCKARLARNPLRLLDCKEEGCRSLREEAPQILDYLDEDCKKHFMKVLEYLDELNLPYALNPYVVRGLDYYNRTIFEFWSAEDAEGKNALGGGGRYDGLVELLGGRESTPAIGLAMGIDRIVSKMREKDIAVPEIYQPEIFLAQLGESAKKKALVLYEKLRKRFRVSQAFFKDGLKAQLEMANKSKVRFTLILGQKEVGDGTILLRDMEGGIQEIIDFNKIEAEVAKRLEKPLETPVLVIEEPAAGEDASIAVKKMRKNMGHFKEADMEKDFTDEADKQAPDFTPDFETKNFGGGDYNESGFGGEDGEGF